MIILFYYITNTPTCKEFFRDFFNKSEIVRADASFFSTINSGKLYIHFRLTEKLLFVIMIMVNCTHNKKTVKAIPHKEHLLDFVQYLKSLEGQTPMTKNTANSHQTVTVLSQDGEQTGLTYPRRAAGLVKKGRARYVNDNTIRLENVSNAPITEDITMDNININNEQEQSVNRLYFNAREWSFNKACDKNVGSRSFMQGPDGIITEAFTIGDWGYNWTEIGTKQLILPKNMLHTLTFWLNGGENDNNNEVCRLEILFDNDYDNRYTYNLNRNFIKPLKKYNGWELYEIPFITADNDYTQLRFVAQRAYMTVMAAKPKEAYADLPDILDEFEGERPQRHNIVFDDGFPTNTWYSTRALREKHKRNNSDEFKDKSDQFSGNGNGNFNMQIPPMSEMLPIPDLSSISSRIQAAVQEALSQADPNVINSDKFDEEIRSQIEEAIEDATSEIEDLIAEIEDQIEELTNSINEQIDEMNQD